jgi:hypothetical protein
MTSVPSARYRHAAVWTGKEMVVWGGGPGDAVDTGGRYDPTQDSWRPTTTLGAPSARFPEDAVWTGREMVVWGGFVPVMGGYVASGGRYDPQADRWASVSMENAPSARYTHTAVWTGRSLIIWGGALENQAYLNNGARYFPDDSTDNDDDGLSECEGDCNDGLAMAFPGATEICDGLDQDCDGAIDETDADGDGYFICEDCDDVNAAAFPGATEICDGLDQDCDGAFDETDADGDGYLICEDCDDSDPSLHDGAEAVWGLRLGADKSTLSWLEVVPCQGYDVVRGRLSELPAGGQGAESCLAERVQATWTEDATIPLPGEGYWYIVRAWIDCPGSYGASSNGYPRVTAACDP